MNKTNNQLLNELNQIEAECVKRPFPWHLMERRGDIIRELSGREVGLTGKYVYNIMEVDIYWSFK